MFNSYFSNGYFVWTMIFFFILALVFARSVSRRGRRAADAIEAEDERIARLDAVARARRGLVLESPAFEDGGVIPQEHTVDGAAVSPELRWSGVPAGTREFVLICEDPDAPGPGSFVHWLVYNLSPTTTSLPPGLPDEASLELPVRCDQGRNSLGTIGYTGPEPPWGDDWHRYFFRLYALDEELAVPPGATRAVIAHAMNRHVLARTELMGRYRRVAKKMPAA